MGWQQPLAGRSWEYRYYTELFPQALAELDPTRPYATGSPYSPGAALDKTHPNDPDHGTHHQWEVWNRLDYSEYRSEIPRLCTEFGFQARPAWHTISQAMGNPDGSPPGKKDPVWLSHQKAEDGNDKLDRAWRRIWVCRTISPISTGRPNSTRPARSRTPLPTTGPGGRGRPAPSSGSSTTAGR